MGLRCVYISLSVCLPVCFFPVCMYTCAYIYIQEGNEILKINGHSTKSMSHSDAIRTIKLEKHTVRLVLRHEIQDEHEGECVCVCFLQVLVSLAHLIGTSFKIHTV